MSQRFAVAAYASGLTPESRDRFARYALWAGGDVYAYLEKWEARKAARRG